jgi:hypothetical protein
VRLHDLRHTGATALLSGYADGEKFSITEVGRFLGHRDVKTTQIYARTSEAELFAEVARRSARATFDAPEQSGTPDPSDEAASSEPPEIPGDPAGTPGWTRTSDPRLRRPLLYPAELRARVMHKVR